MSICQTESAAYPSPSNMTSGTPVQKLPRRIEIHQERMGICVVDAAKQPTITLCFDPDSSLVAGFSLTHISGIEGYQSAFVHILADKVAHARTLGLTSMQKDWPIVPSVPLVLDNARNGFNAAAQIIRLLHLDLIAELPGARSTRTIRVKQPTEPTLSMADLERLVLSYILDFNRPSAQPSSVGECVPLGLFDSEVEHLAV